MTHRRRVTDRLPLSDIVSRGNLDDRLSTVNGRIDGHINVENERWIAHKEQHAELAASLREYKSEANEWRKTVSDLRSDFLLKSESVAEIRRVESLVTGLDARLDSVERGIQSINDRSVATRGVFSDTRNVLATAGIIFGAVASALLIFNRLNP